MKRITFLGALIIVVLISHPGVPAEAAATSTPLVENTSTSTNVHNRAAVESRVREYFTDVPVMIEIARCESNFRQFTDGGSVLGGGSGGGMVGVFQLYGDVHDNAATNLGFDINTLEGNIGYARHLYESSGTDPWLSCVPTVAETNIQLLHRIDLLKQLLSLLQQLLALQLSMR